jgi:two-component system sensor histidine kinase YesM
MADPLQAAAVPPPARGRASIKRQIRYSYAVIIGMMLVPPLIGVGSSLLQTARYDRVITAVSKTNRINQLIKIDIGAELWDIVAGAKKFGVGRQYVIIADVNTALADIMATTDVVENRRMLEVAGRAVDTLTGYVDRLGAQIAAKAPVSANETILTEIRGVAALVSDILQDFIVLEIESAARTNDSIKRAARLLVAGQLAVVALATAFAAFAQRRVAASINRPLDRLAELSRRIASGDLAARAELPRVAELDPLTDDLNTMAAKIRELVDANNREQQNRRKSEMRVLQAQIAPHFLYNTLDTIVWLAEARKFDQVISITRSLAAFFRISLNRGKDWISVAEEFAHIDNYLSIQKIRYRDILDYAIGFDPAIAAEPVLKLVLQPLVENALYHGIKNKRGRGFIAVDCRRADGYLRFSVQDDGIGMTEERLADVQAQLADSGRSEAPSDVYGLYNVSQRLALYYSPDARLEIASAPRAGTTVSFRVPEAAAGV